ncbi:hypothetical protein [Streptomyces sp. YIM S03343]
MYTRGRSLRFTAVVTLVVVSLTGFSTGRHHSTRHRSGSHSSSGSGGGCSSSHQDHDGYKSSGSTYKKRHSTPSSTTGGSSTTALQDGTAVLVSCASKKRPYATVEVTNPNGKKAGFRFSVDFLDDNNDSVDYAVQTATVPAKSSTKVKVPFNKHDGVQADGPLSLVDHCFVDPSALIKP